MNDIQIYNNSQFGELRALIRDDDPWFVLRDICDALGINQTHDAMRVLDDDEKAKDNILTLGGMQEMALVSEAGLYRLIMRSRKPEAKAFQRWVTHEVLPAIRKTGGYIAAAPDESPETIMARALIVANETLERQKKQIEELKPKALFADAVGASDGTCLIGELAKMMRQNGVNIGQNRLFEWMRENGYLGNVGQNRNVPTQRAMELGLFRIKETAITHSDGHVTINRTPKVTGKGQRYFIEKFCHEKAS